MSTLITAAILIGIVVITCLLFVFIHSKNKRINMRQHLKKISEVGSENGLIFSSHEIETIYHWVDGIYRKIVVIKNQI